jgi:hypothetical protein
VRYRSGEVSGEAEKKSVVERPYTPTMALQTQLTGYCYFGKFWWPFLFNLCELSPLGWALPTMNCLINPVYYLDSFTFGKTSGGTGFQPVLAQGLTLRLHFGCNPGPSPEKLY